MTRSRMIQSEIVGPPRLVCLIALALLVSVGPVRACLWDNDTLAAEQARFPEIAELITGQFPRHSKEFYAWRLLHSENLIARGSGGAVAYDDLAVAQHKLGDHHAAIETMKLKETKFPGLYETLSNLGTFYIYTGDLELAADSIRQALAMNPEAHFGREKYQLWIIEWLQERKELEQPPVSRGGSAMLATGIPQGFAAFVAQKVSKEASDAPRDRLRLTRQEQAAALRGLLGMMWFADFDNPLLLEALGDVLVAGDVKTNAAQLAAMSYLHASRKVSDESEKKRLQALFEASLLLTQDAKGIDYEKKLDAGLAKGMANLDAIRQDELGWIKAGLDAGIEFQKKYLKP